MTDTQALCDDLACNSISKQAHRDGFRSTQARIPSQPGTVSVPLRAKPIRNPVHCGTDSVLHQGYTCLRKLLLSGSILLEEIPCCKQLFLRSRNSSASRFVPCKGDPSAYSRKRPAPGNMEPLAPTPDFEIELARICKHSASQPLRGKDDWSLGFSLWEFFAPNSRPRNPTSPTTPSEQRITLSSRYGNHLIAQAKPPKRRSREWGERGLLNQVTPEIWTPSLLKNNST